MYTFSIFFFCLTIIPLLAMKWVFPFEGVRRMIIIVSGNFAHDHVHTHVFGTISHSLQGMAWIQLDGTGDFSSKTHYFVHLLKYMISNLNI